MHNNCRNLTRKMKTEIQSKLLAKKLNGEKIHTL
jgi:hypothetical protein